MRPRLTATMLASVIGLWSCTAIAEDIKTDVRPLTIIVPAPSGGGTDLFARSLAAHVETSLGTKITIDNKPGGGGALGVTHLVAARPDGSTLALVWNSPLTAMPHHLTVPYTLDHYRPVMSFGYSSYALCTQVLPGINNGADFVRYLKANSGKLTYGNDGSGGTLHLAAERLFMQVGTRVRGIPQSGSGDTAQALLSGQVNIYGGSVPPILQHVASGKVKCHLVTSKLPNMALPDTDGLSAVAMGAQETVLWWGLIAPAQTPDAIVQRLEAEFTRAAKRKEFDDLMNKQGVVTRILDSSEMSFMLRQEYRDLGIVSRMLGLQHRS